MNYEERSKKWHVLAKSAADANAASGFHVAGTGTTLETMALIYLIGSELYEAEDAIFEKWKAGDKQETPATEIADAAIRAISVLENLTDGEWTLRTRATQSARTVSLGFAVSSFDAMREIYNAAEWVRKGNTKFAVEHLELLIPMLHALYNHLNKTDRTFEQEIWEKIEVNKLRPYLHGKKA